MPPPASIPGFYYDEEKKRYFKIEKSQNATSSTRWTAATVRKRQEDQDAAAEVQRKRQAISCHVKRTPLLSDSLRGAWLAREFGPDLGECGVGGAGWARRRQIGINLSESAGRTWARNVRAMGRLQFLHSENAGLDGRVDAGYGMHRQSNLKSLWVGECGSSCTGLAYTAMDYVLVNAYIPLRAGRIAPTGDESDARHISGIPGSAQLPFLQDINCIVQSADRERMFLASSYPSDNPVLTYAPCQADQNLAGPDVTLPRVQPISSNDFTLIEPLGQNSPRDRWITYSLIAGRRNSDIVASIAGNRGLLQLTSNGKLISMYGPNPRLCKPDEVGKYPRDIFAHDFLHESPNVTIAGGDRAAGNVWTLDTRVRDIVNVFSHGACVNNLSVISNQQVLVAGLKSRMCIYDLRYIREPPLQGSDAVDPTQNKGVGSSQQVQPAYKPNVVTAAAAATPVVTFPGYINPSHLGTGLAVCPELDVVCAATNLGKVALHSLSSGRKLDVPAIDQIDGGGTPIQSMMFAELPDGTQQPSLYMGVGASIYKFSSLDMEEVETLENREIRLEEERKVSV